MTTDVWELSGIRAVKVIYIFLFYHIFVYGNDSSKPFPVLSSHFLRFSRQTKIAVGHPVLLQLVCGKDQIVFDDIVMSKCVRRDIDIHCFLISPRISQH